MARSNHTSHDSEQRPRYRNRRQHPLVVLGMWGAVAAVFFVGLYFGLRWLKEHDPSLRGTAAPPLGTPLVRIFFLDLHQRYRDDAEAAGQRYTGKVIEIENQGFDRLSRVEKKEGQTALLCFDIDRTTNGPSSSPVVLCLFSAQKEGQLSGLGKRWVVRGRVSSFDANEAVVVLEDCEVVR